MGLIENFINRRKERNRREVEFEDNDKIVSNIERKKLSHNEREMMDILRREKEENLKQALRFEEKRRKIDELFTEREFMKSDIHLLR